MKTEILKQKGEYILAQITFLERIEYATYFQDIDGNKFWGHYFSDLESAENSLEKRAITQNSATDLVDFITPLFASKKDAARFLYN